MNPRRRAPQTLSRSETICSVRFGRRREPDPEIAGYSSYTDHQIGRLLDYLEDSGQLENTLVAMVSDNGSSAEGGPDGTVNENNFFQGVIDTVQDQLHLYDDIGTVKTYNHYPTGWAMAFSTPFKLFKRYSGHEGGIADPMLISSHLRLAVALDRLGWFF